MSKNLQLHEEFGINPTMPICIICGEEKGEIALLGNAYKGEAPKHMVMSLEPCDKCKEKYLKKGVLLVECKNEIPKGQSKAQQIPTGSITVIKTEAFRLVFNQPAPKEHIVKVEVGILKMLQEQTDKANAEHDKKKK